MAIKQMQTINSDGTPHKDQQVKTSISRALVSDDDETRKERAEAIERLAAELEARIVKFEGGFLDSRTELAGMLGSWVVHRNMLIEILAELEITLDMSLSNSNSNAREAIQHIFGVHRTQSLELLRRGVVMAICNFRSMKGKYEAARTKYEELVAKEAIGSSVAKASLEQFNLLQIAHNDLRKKTESYIKTIASFTEKDKCQIIIKTDLPCFLVSTKALGFFIGTEKPVKIVFSADGKKVASGPKVSTLIRTKDTGKALRFMEQGQAQVYLDLVKRQADKINENGGLRAKFISNYAVGVQSINF